MGSVPAGWPDRVRPPGVDGWELDVVAYLLDCCPADFRAYPVLRRHPVVLARFAAQFVDSQCAAVADGLAGVRVSLVDRVGVEVIDSAAELWSVESARLRRTRRAVGLMEDALRDQSLPAHRPHRG